MKLILDFPEWEPNSTLKLEKPFIFIGSCFAENISKKFSELGLPVISNPLGTTFNPVSIADQFRLLVDTGIDPAKYVFENNGLYSHWWMSHKKSTMSEIELQEKISSAREEFQHYISQDPNIIISLGTAWVYQIKEEKMVVSNCHKMPSSLFQKKLLSIDEIKRSIAEISQMILSFTPLSSVFWTISPVRYLREGLVNSQTSKASLRLALFDQLGMNPRMSYYPAYEILTDVLRDYRFYDRDLLHPSEEAVDILFNHFSENAIDIKSRDVLSSLEKFRNFTKHKTIHQVSDLQEDTVKIKILRKKIEDAIPLWNEFGY